MNIGEFLAQNQWITFLILLWSIPWKGVALWKAAKLSDKWWFVAILVLNTVGIVEIFYIYVFSKRKSLKQAAVKNDTPAPSLSK